MELSIISPERHDIHDVMHLEVQTNVGSMVIQPGHAPIIATLIASSELIFVLTNGEKKSIYLTRSAFLDVDRKKAMIIINQNI